MAPFSQLEVFLAVARHRSFSAAARELGVSRSAVSHTVRLLERQLRVVLLARTTRSVSLTDTGKRLVDSAGPLLGQVAVALAEVSPQPGETVGRLRLSVPPMAVPFVIEPVLPTFRARHPRVEVEVVIEERFVDILAERYDAGGIRFRTDGERAAANRKPKARTRTVRAYGSWLLPLLSERRTPIGAIAPLRRGSEGVGLARSSVTATRLRAAAIASSR